MANKIVIKRSNVPAKVPTTAQLDLGELALNTYDGKLYLKKNDGAESIVQIGAAGATGPTGPSGATGIAGPTGATGVAGTNGATGPTGPIGITGATGVAGANGATGATGVQGITGPTGVTGATGVQGTTGPTGVRGGVGYTFSTTTTDSDPGSGNVRYNSAVAVTQLFISNSDAAGNNQTAWYNTWDDSTNSVKGYVTLRSSLSTGTVTNIFRVTGAVVNATTYYKIPVTYVSGSLPPNSTALVVSFSATGDQGSTGPTGVQGTTGPTGVQGTTGPTGVQGTTGPTGVQGTTGPTGVQGTTGPTGVQGITGPTGVVGVTGATGVQGATGPTGPATAINATEDTTSTVLYPVMVAAAGSNQTPKIRATATAFSFNASTGALAIGGNFSAAGGTFSSDVSLTGTGYLDLPVGTTAQRPGSPNAGMIRYNSDNAKFEGYDTAFGPGWGPIGTAAGGGADRVFLENGKTVTTNYTITTNYNAVTAGPVTVNSGVTVTIPSGSTWSIV